MKIVISSLLFAATLASAVPPEVTNVSAAQRPGTKFIDVTYDLTSPDGGDSTIQLEISFDGGLTWRAPVKTVSGHIGEGVGPGTNRIASWNAGVDFDGNIADNCRARVSAFDGDDPTPPVGMVYIPPGTFQMGDLKGGAEPVIVNISKGFFIERFETEGSKATSVLQWARQNGYDERHDQWSGSSGFPATGFTTRSVFLYANARSEMEGLRPVYYTDADLTVAAKAGQSTYVDASANGYRLPTQAEWEKAARGGLIGKRFANGDTISNSKANFKGTVSSIEYDLSGVAGFIPPSTGEHIGSIYERYLSPIGSYEPNGYGLYDIDGNVGEICADGLYSAIADGAIDPFGDRVTHLSTRGGNSSYTASGLGIGKRSFTHYTTTSSPGSVTGVRLARNLTN